MSDDTSLPSIKTRHLDIIEKYGGKHGGKIVAAITAAQVAAPLVKTAVAYLRRNEDYTITISGNDDIYPDLHEWVLARIPRNERRAMIASTGENVSHVRHESSSDDEDIPPVRLRYDGSKPQRVEIDGHLVMVNVHRENMASMGREKVPEGWRRYLERITFTASNVKGRDATVRMIEGL